MYTHTGVIIDNIKMQMKHKQDNHVRIHNSMVLDHQPSIKYILKHRANELSSERICGILFQQNECTMAKNLIDFTIQPAHGTVLKVRIIVLLIHMTIINKRFHLNRLQRSIIFMNMP